MASWKQSCDLLLRDLSGSSGSLHHLLLSSQQASFRHFLFAPPKRSRPIESDTDTEGQYPPKRSRASKKPLQPREDRAVLQPTASYTIDSILQLQAEGKIAEPTLPRMKKIRNESGVTLCLPFLLGATCNLGSSCGYHLQAVPAPHLPGTSRSEYSSLHQWLRDHNRYVRLTPTASQNEKLKI